MRRSLRYAMAMLAALLLCVSQLMAQGDYSKKLSSYVRSVLSTSRQQAKAAKAKGLKAPSPKIMAFVRASNPSVLTDAGCTIHDVSGDIYIATIPLSAMEQLAENESVERIEANQMTKAKMDTTATIINAEPVYQGLSLPQAYTGKGVVVGMIDGDFDLTHPTLYSTDHSTYRLQRMWDMSDSTSTVGTEAPYESIGRQFTTQADLLAKAHSTVYGIRSHGTHCIGIAAGGGYGTPYRGMAYESDIMLVDNNAVEKNTPNS